MKVSVVMAACNAGPMLAETIDAANDSLRRVDHEIIVVNDQSTDGCCNNLSSKVILINTSCRRGCSFSRYLGSKAATGDIVIITDPHCFYPDRALERMATQALDSQSIVQPPIWINGKSLAKGHRAHVHDNAVQKGINTCRVNRFCRYSVLGGSIYVFNRDVARILMSVRPLPGWWTYWELYYSTIAYRAGISIVVADIPPCVHRKYRPNRKLPYSLPSYHRDLNAYWYYNTCLSKYYCKMFAKILSLNLRPEITRNDKSISTTRKHIDSISVRSECWFLRNVVGMR